MPFNKKEKTISLVAGCVLLATITIISVACTKKNDPVSTNETVVSSGADSSAVASVASTEDLTVKEIKSVDSIEGYAGDIKVASVEIVPKKVGVSQLLWASSDDAIATTDNKGNIALKKAGTASITISSANGVCKVINVKVLGGGTDTSVPASGKVTPKTDSGKVISKPIVKQPSSNAPKKPSTPVVSKPASSGSKPSSGGNITFHGDEENGNYFDEAGNYPYQDCKTLDEIAGDSGAENMINAICICLRNNSYTKIKGHWTDNPALIPHFCEMRRQARASIGWIEGQNDQEMSNKGHGDEMWGDMLYDEEFILTYASKNMQNLK